MQYGECAAFKLFIDANKPVFHVEYSNEGVKKREARKKDNYDEDDYSGNGSNSFESGADCDADESDSDEDDSIVYGYNTADSTALDANQDKSIEDSPKNSGFYENDSAPAAGSTNESNDDDSNRRMPMKKNRARLSSHLLAAPGVSTHDVSTSQSALSDIAASLVNGSSDGAASVPGFSNITKELHLGAGVQFCNGFRQTLQGCCEGNPRELGQYQPLADENKLTLRLMLCRWFAASHKAGVF